MRTFGLLLCCVGAAAAAKKPLDDKGTHKAAEAKYGHIKSRLATQTTRPAFEQGRRRVQCVNDDSTLDSGDDTCSAWYDKYPESCGKYDDEDFTASEQCCACGKDFTFAPTATYAPTVSPLVAVDGYGPWPSENGIRTAVALWLSNRDEAIKKYGHIKDWDTSQVTDMSQLFCASDSWRCDCNYYNTAAESFNEDISAWDTSGVTTMYGMFCGASAFNQPIGGWRVDKVTHMNYMFRRASAFDQPIGNWRVDNVKYMPSMFEEASAFNQPIGDWRVNKVTNMVSIFRDALSFNQPIGDWRVDLVEDMTYVFQYASSFNQPLNDWRVHKVRSMEGMFFGASAFNQPLGDWRVDKVTDMSVMFEGAASFNQPIGGWQVDQVADMSYMFDGASAFDRPLGDWSVGNVGDFRFMFKGATSFNQPLSGWSVAKAMNMRGMFKGASAFDQDLGWCVGNDVSLKKAFTNTPCSSTSCGVEYDGFGDCGYKPTRTPTREPTPAYLPTYRPTLNDACSNGVQDGEESDVDCGGPPPCPRCEMERKCRVWEDCETGYCESRKCWPNDVDADDFDECDKYYCGNDPYWRYDAGDKGLLGCDDIAGEPEKIENRCRTQERIGVDATGREVRASWACKGVCRFECEGC